MSRIFTPAEKEIINEYLLGRIEYLKECIQFHKEGILESSGRDIRWHNRMIEQYEDYLHRAVFDREKLNNPEEE